MAVINQYGDRVDKMLDLVYRPDRDQSRMEPIPYYPSLDIARSQPLPYRPQEQEAETLVKQGADFLNDYIKGVLSTPTEVAGGIPVGQDPNLPMSQEEFNDYIWGRVESRRGTLPRLLKEKGYNSLMDYMRANQVRGI